MTTPDYIALTGLLLGLLGFAVTVAWLVIETWGETS